MYAIGMNKEDVCHVLTQNGTFSKKTWKAHLFHTYNGALQYANIFIPEEYQLYYKVYEISVTWKVGLCTSEGCYYLSKSGALTPKKEEAMDLEFPPNPYVIARKFGRSAKDVKISYNYELLA